MLHYVRNDVSEGDYFNKVNDSCACKICHYTFFFKMNFKFKRCLYDDWYDYLQRTSSFNEVTFVSVREKNFRFHVLVIRINQSMSGMKNAVLN